MTPRGRPRKYHSREERAEAKKEQARLRREAGRRRERLDKFESRMRAYFAQMEAEKGRRSRNPTGLSYQQKRELAQELLWAAGDIAENIRSQPRPEVDPDDVAKQLALWLRHLPGKYWDERLGDRDWMDAELKAQLHARIKPPLEREGDRPGVKVPLHF
jgi:hypothetical protein